jgi:hypothetical protein
MEPDKNELSDAELDALLQAWEAPDAPKTLRAAIFSTSPRAWQKFWSGSLRIPIPVFCGTLCAIVLLAALAVWRWHAPRVIVQTQRVEVPVVKERIVYQDRVVRVPAPSPPRASEKLRPVADLNPRIIRSGDFEN